MIQTSKPSPQQVRNYIARRRTETTPPPAPDQIRAELGWKLIAAERRGQP